MPRSSRYCVTNLASLSELPKIKASLYICSNLSMLKISVFTNHYLVCVDKKAGFLTSRAWRLPNTACLLSSAFMQLLPIGPTDTNMSILLFNSCREVYFVVFSYLWKLTLTGTFST